MRNHLHRLLMGAGKLTAGLWAACRPLKLTWWSTEGSQHQLCCVLSHLAAYISIFPPTQLRHQCTVLFLCSGPGEFLRAQNQEDTDLHINVLLKYKSSGKWKQP